MLLVDSSDDSADCEVILSPPFIYLHDLVSRVQGRPFFSVAAQNCSDKEKGAYTGEVSASMLSSIGVEYVIIGHSERRQYYQESGVIISDKIKVALKNNLIPIYCCGETKAVREKGQHFDFIRSQLDDELFHLDADQISECVIAYEPVWAIGTGLNATASQASEIHGYLRKSIREKYNDKAAEVIPIIYGGSVAPKNAAELFSAPDVDGALVGGASLKAVDFMSVIETMNSLLLSK